jgi:transcriptional regulator with XRE-family HTH domain
MTTAATRTPPATVNARDAVLARLADLGWSRAELSRRSGVSVISLTRWLSGAQPSLTTTSLDRVCKPLGLALVVTARKR